MHSTFPTTPLYQLHIISYHHQLGLSRLCRLIKTSVRPTLPIPSASRPTLDNRRIMDWFHFTMDASSNGRMRTSCRRCQVIIESLSLAFRIETCHQSLSHHISRRLRSIVQPYQALDTTNYRACTSSPQSVMA